MNNEMILNEIHNANNHSTATQKAYKQAVDSYCTYYEMTLHELIMEAEKEENEGIRWKLRSIKRRLIEYRHYLLENFTFNTYKTWFYAILNIYKYFEIEIYELPKVNYKSVHKPKPINYRDLPDKEIIREAINICPPSIKAVILFMASSGCARQETVNLTINDYITSLSEYTDKEDIYEIIENIKHREDIVPTWSIWRQKTNTYYTTYSSPESVVAINSYLISRNDKITGESKLFKLNKDYIMQRFITINNELNLGTVGDNGYNRFRTHMLRKFHASALYNSGMSIDKVNDLQGKAKNKTDAAYFMTNPDDLKREYIQHLPAVTINQDVEKITIKSPEFIKLEQENTELKDKQSKLDDILLRIEKLEDESTN